MVCLCNLTFIVDSYNKVNKTLIILLILFLKSVEINPFICKSLTSIHEYQV